MEAMPVQWLLGVPPVTRYYMLSVVGVGWAVQKGFLPFKLGSWPSGDFLNDVISLTYAGQLSISLATRLFIFSQYATSLEEAADSTWDFLWFLGVILTLIITYSKFVYNIWVPSQLLRDVMLYIWSVREPEVNMALVGLIPFQSKWTPWINILLPKAVPIDSASSVSSFNIKRDCAAMFIGHFYWFVNDQIPRLYKIKSPLMPIWKRNQADNEGERGVFNPDAPVNEDNRNGDENGVGIENENEDSNDNNDGIANGDGVENDNGNGNATENAIENSNAIETEVLADGGLE